MPAAGALMLPRDLPCSGGSLTMIKFSGEELALGG
jgi:hypothetical protein